MYSINSTLFANARHVPDISGSCEQLIHAVKGDKSTPYHHKSTPYHYKSTPYHYKSTPYHYINTSLQKRQLNPNAESFVPSISGVRNGAYIPNSSQISILHELTSHSLNFSANIFISRHAYHKSRLCAMIGLIATFLILSAFI